MLMYKTAMPLAALNKLYSPRTYWGVGRVNICQAGNLFHLSYRPVFEYRSVVVFNENWGVSCGFTSDLIPDFFCPLIMKEMLFSLWSICNCIDYMDFHDGGSNVTWIAGFVLEDLSAVGIGLNKTEVLIKLKKKCLLEKFRLPYPQTFSVIIQETRVEEDWHRVHHDYHDVYIVVGPYSYATVNSYRWKSGTTFKASLFNLYPSLN